jgi:hypothetical protein
MEQITYQCADVGRGLQGGHLDLILLGLEFFGRFALDGFLQFFDVPGRKPIITTQSSLKNQPAYP